MIFLKKILFALPFTFFTIAFIFLLKFFLEEPNSIFSLDSLTIARSSLLLLSLFLGSLYFVIFVTLAADWRLVLPVFVLPSLFPLLFFPQPFNLVLVSGLIFSFGATYFMLERKLGTYLTFQTNSLLAPSVKQLFTLLVVVSSIAFYLSSSLQISTAGFKLPDSLLNLASGLVSQQAGELLESQLPQITPQQMELAKQNSSFLKQLGIDPGVLDSFSQPQTQTPAQKMIKSTLESQVQTSIHPYLSYLPIILTAVLFLTLKSAGVFLYPLLYLLLWLTFLVLEKTGFIHYEIEMREVKKLIV